MWDGSEIKILFTSEVFLQKNFLYSFFLSPALSPSSSSSPYPAPLPLPPTFLPFLKIASHFLTLFATLGPRRDTHDVYRPWYFPQLLPIERAHETGDHFLAFVPYFDENSFFWDGFPRPSSVHYYDRFSRSAYLQWVNSQFPGLTGCS